MADQNNSLYLSDVHMHNKTQTVENMYLSRFFFKFPSKRNNETEDAIFKQEYVLKKCQVAEDEDGDFDIVSSIQKCPNESHDSPFPQDASCHRLVIHEHSPTLEVITLEHMMQTSLHDVGYQVWPGALLLCDFLLHHKDSYSEKIVLDLGAGTGLTSIVAALCCGKVICTDYCQEIIKLAQRNWIRNQGLLPVPTHLDDMKFMVLNWAENDLHSENKSVNPEMPDSDNLLLRSASLLLAAEAVYDDELTDACFSTIYHLLRKSPEKEVLMAVERRIIFSSISREVCSPAYEHFRDNLTDLSSIDEGDIRFTHHQIPIQDLPKYFVYTRTKELELWRISSSFTSRSSDILAGIDT